MRRAARIVAPILIVFTTIGHWPAVRSITPVVTAAAIGATLDPFAATSVALLVAESTSHRVVAARRVESHSSHAIAATSLPGTAAPVCRRAVAPAGVHAADVFDPGSARDRAPPL